jgi:tRNA(Arg) A34 adenosine deaminase TadA
MKMSDGVQEYMKTALEEAKQSLKEGNHGFGAVIVKDGRIIAKAHDQEENHSDPTSHAELNAIRLAAKEFGRNLEGCVLITTHEPCPMCATAIVWSGIKELVYGYSIAESIAEGRRRINLSSKELFTRANANIGIHEGVLHDQCAILYRNDVRAEVKRLRGSVRDLAVLRQELLVKRASWFHNNHGKLQLDYSDLLHGGYLLLLTKLGIEPEEAPVMEKTQTKIVFHSRNFCPTLEACKILDLDTRIVCREVSEKPTDFLMKQFNGRLEFRRNYDKLRPYCEYCEEMILLKEQ